METVTLLVKDLNIETRNYGMDEMIDIFTMDEIEVLRNGKTLTKGGVQYVDVHAVAGHLFN